MVTAERPVHDLMRETAQKEGWLPLHAALEALMLQAMEGKIASSKEYLQALEAIMDDFRKSQGPED